MDGTYYQHSNLSGVDGFLACFYVCLATLCFWYGWWKATMGNREPDYISQDDSKGDVSFCEDDWNKICLSAINGAKEGNHSDRQWVMDNILDGPELKEKEEEGKKPKTSKTIINEVIATLRSMGHKASEAKKLVIDLASKKVYHSAEELLVGVYKR